MKSVLQIIVFSSVILLFFLPLGPVEASIIPDPVGIISHGGLYLVDGLGSDSSVGKHRSAGVVSSSLAFRVGHTVFHKMAPSGNILGSMSSRAPRKNGHVVMKKSISKRYFSLVDSFELTSEQSNASVQSSSRYSVRIPPQWFNPLSMEWVDIRRLTRGVSTWPPRPRTNGLDVSLNQTSMALFGLGFIGLIGIARRSIFSQ